MLCGRSPSQHDWHSLRQCHHFVGAENKVADAEPSHTFADRHGLANPEDVQAAGLNLARWVYKQRTLYRQGAIGPELGHDLAASESAAR